MKRRISLLLAVVMILGSFSFVFAAEEPSAEAKAGEFLKKVDVLEGINGDLKLGDNLRRQDMVVLIARLMGEEDAAEEFPVEGLTFKDFNDPYYKPIIAWAVSNKLIEGHTPERFGFNENVTAQDYATVLLRALGYEVNDENYAKVLEEAKKLGLLEDVEVENGTALTRGQMAVMTFNALGTNMKDSEKTLAEKLSIEMPAPEKLEVEEVKADNLKEIEIKLNKAVDADSAINVDNYETNAGDIKDINYIESENLVRLLLDGKMTNKKDYKLTIDGVKDDKNVLDLTEEFTAVDNAIPEVVEVVGLGTKAVKVVMSEPVDGVANKNFKLDDKAVYGQIQVAAGRDIIIKTHTAMSVGEHTLTVTGLKDYAGFKSVESDHKFEVVEDKENPTVEVASATLNRVVLEFSEDVDNISANKVYWKNGSTKVYADKVNRLAGNKFEVIFKSADGLPAHETTLYVEGVVDYSGNKLENPEVLVKPTIDTTRPVVRSVEAKKQGKVIEVKFNKPVNTEKGEKASALNIARYTVLDKDDDKVTISEITNAKKDQKTFEIVLGKALDAEETYTLKIEGIKDTNRYANYMVDYSEKIAIGDYDVPKLEEVAIRDKTDGDDRIHTITLFFNRDMDVETVSNPDNYLLEVDGANKLLSKLDYDIVIKDSDARKVVLTVTTEKKDNVKITAVAGLGLKGSNGKELSNYGKMVKPNTDDFEIESVVAKAKDKVEVTFSKSVEEAPEKAFTIKDEKVKEVTIKNNVVTIVPTTKLGADAYNYKLKVVDVDAVKSYLGSDDAYKLKGDKVWELEDKIAPLAEEVKATYVPGAENVVLKVEFDEEVYATDLASTDLVVKKINGDAKVEFNIVDAGEVDAGEKVGKKVMTINVPVQNILADDADENTKFSTAFSVEVVENARFIKDMKDNAAKEKTVRSEKVEDIVLPAVPVSKDALNAKIGEAEALKEGDYTVETKKAFDAALVKAEEVRDNEEATQEEVDNALKELKEAVEALKVNTYTVTFEVKYNDEVVADAVVTVGNEEVTENTVSLANGLYAYKVVAEGYDEVTGTFEVNKTNKSVPVTLTVTP